ERKARAASFDFLERNWRSGSSGNLHQDSCARVALFQTRRWRDEPYSVLSAGLKFGKVGITVPNEIGADNQCSVRCSSTKVESLRCSSVLSVAGSSCTVRRRRMAKNRPIVPASNAIGGSAHRMIVLLSSGGLSRTNSP